MSDRTWTDQPTIVEGIPIRVSCFAHGRSLEIRSDDAERHYVTIGNLFGSQTVSCPSLMEALRVFNVAANAAKHPQLELPDGCKLVQ